jgi:hypothetical protein
LSFIMGEPGPVRVKVAMLATSLLEGQLDYRTFLEGLPEDAMSFYDPEITELLDLIEHEPAVGGLFGATPAKSAEYRAKIWSIVEQLKRNPDP